jgi:hypothetical protein
LYYFTLRIGMKPYAVEFASQAAPARKLGALFKEVDGRLDLGIVVGFWLARIGCHSE